MLFRLHAPLPGPLVGSRRARNTLRGVALIQRRTARYGCNQQPTKMDSAAAVDAPPAAERAGDGELPVDVLVLVLLPLVGDAPSLCAAACVARSWRKAAASPRLWTRIGHFRDNAATLTNERLLNLVSRAQHGLQQLNLTGIYKSNLTDEGLAEALRSEQHILLFAANGRPLTGAGIAAALAPSRGRLGKLRVCCVRALPKPESPGAMSVFNEVAFVANCNKTLDELRALLAPDGVMKATAVCSLELDDDVLCTRMCGRKNVCSCGAMYCKSHADRVSECVECEDKVCDACCGSENLCMACAFG